MTSPAYHIAQKIAEGTSLVLGQTIFVGSEPATPVDVATIYDTGGEGSKLAIDGNTPTIQVRSRSKTYMDGYNQQNTIKLLLESLTNFTHDGFNYSFIALQSDIGKIGRDANQNHLFTSNYFIERQRL